jgi:hypothetical protein
MSPSTIKIYVYAVAKFSAFHGRSPDMLTTEDVRAYRLHLISLGYQPTSVNPIMGALRFFYGTTLGRKEAAEQIPYARRADKLPAVLTSDEVVRFLTAVSDLKMRTIFITIYAAGLRVSKAVALTAKDIDSARMVIVVRQGKGRKDRYVMLSDGLLFQTAAETLTTIAKDAKRLGAEIGLTAVLHTWGQNLDHHPHVHCIVPGGGLSAGRARWVHCRPGFFLPVHVLSRLFRRLFLDGLVTAFDAGQLQFFGDLAALKDREAFLAHLAPSRTRERVVYAKQPFAGSAQVLAYLARYTHRVAIGSRIVELTNEHVRFRWKDYRVNGRSKSKVMALAVGEFMRRFLMHVLSDGFHRIRHYGLFANGRRVENIAL